MPCSVPLEPAMLAASFRTAGGKAARQSAGRGQQHLVHEKISRFPENALQKVTAERNPKTCAFGRMLPSSFRTPPPGRTMFWKLA